jgi:twitching motility protein PilT
MAKIDAFFRLMNSQGASDLHIMAGGSPCLRIHGDVEPIKYHELTNDELLDMLVEITPEHKMKEFQETGDVDFAYELPGVSRYRANFLRQSNGESARRLPADS